jgi:hypothetical protein
MTDDFAGGNPGPYIPPPNWKGLAWRLRRRLADVYQPMFRAGEDPLWPRKRDADDDLADDLRLWAEAAPGMALDVVEHAGPWLLSNLAPVLDALPDEALMPLARRLRPLLIRIHHEEKAGNSQGGAR